MITVLIVVLVSVIVLDIVVISRAVHRIRERRVKADPLSLHDPGPRPARRDRIRWLEPAGASQDPGSRPRGTSHS